MYYKGKSLWAPIVGGALIYGLYIAICSDKVSEQRNFPDSIGLGGDKAMHCYSLCKITKSCLISGAFIGWLFEEYQRIEGKINPKSTAVYDPEDITANEYGRDCAFSKKKYCNKDKCEECCKEKYSKGK